MVETQTDERWAEAARNRSLVCAVNDQIDRLTASLLADETAQAAYLCECADLSCAQLIEIPHELRRRVHRDAAEFVVVPGHELPEVEEVVERGGSWIVVRTRRPGASVVKEFAAANEVARTANDEAHADGRAGRHD